MMSNSILFVFLSWNWEMYVFLSLHLITCIASYTEQKQRFYRVTVHMAIGQLK